MFDMMLCAQTIGQLAELYPNDVACYYMAYREEAPLADDVVPRITFLVGVAVFEWCVVTIAITVQSARWHCASFVWPQRCACGWWGLHCACARDWRASLRTGLPPSILASAAQMAAQLEQRAVVSEFSALIARL
jgi:hypothetical protein